MKLNTTLLAMIFIGLSGSVFANSVKDPAPDVDGWVDIYSNDTVQPVVADQNPYDLKCEYRFFYNQQPNTFYATALNPSELGAIAWDKSGNLSPLVINASNKTVMHQLASKSDVAIDRMQKRCSLPDTSPQGMIGLFLTESCPAGWQEWPFAKIDMQCVSSNCPVWILCKKVD